MDFIADVFDILATAGILLSLPVLLVLAGYWPLAILYFIGLGAIL